MKTKKFNSIKSYHFNWRRSNGFDNSTQCDHSIKQEVFVDDLSSSELLLSSETRFTLPRFFSKSKSLEGLNKLHKLVDSSLLSKSTSSTTSLLNTSTTQLRTSSIFKHKRRPFSGRRIKNILTPLRFSSRKLSPKTLSATEKLTPSLSSNRASLCLALNSDLESRKRTSKKNNIMEPKIRFDKIFTKIRSKSEANLHQSENSLLKKSRCYETERTNFPQTQTNWDSLRDHLKDKGAVENFRNFLQQEFNEENLDFWLDVEKYKQQKSGKKRKSADKIFDTYLREESSKEVNLDNRIKKSIQAKREDLDPDLFDPAQDQIYKLMENDPFPRYLARKRKASD